MRELKWLESLVPKPPPVDADQRGNLQLLEIIQENTEYLPGRPAKSRSSLPRMGIRLFGQGVRAFKTLRIYLTALSKSDQLEY
jgi:hypothetical protein